jgi:hypothetical protein
MTTKSVLFRFGSDVSGLMQGLAQGKGGLRELDKAADGVTGTLTKFAGLLGAGLGIAKLTADALAFADSMVRIHDQTDLSFDSIQRFSFIAGQTGGSVEQLAGAVSKMQRTLSDAGDDGEKARKAIEGLGLDVSALMAMQPDQQFQAIASAIGAIPNPADQAAAAVDVFGKAGAEMLPQLKAMAESGVELAAQFDAIGGPVSENAIRAVDALGDSGAATGVQIKNMATELLALAAPAIIAGLETIQQILGGIRVLAGGGSNEIVNMSMEIDALEASLASLKKNNPFPDAFAQAQMDNYVSQIAKLNQALNDMTGSGIQSVRTIIPVMEEWGASIGEMPLLTADALAAQYDSEVVFTLQQQAEFALREEMAALHWENLKAITTDGTDAITKIQGASLSKAEMFNAQSWDNQVETVSGSLMQMTAGIAQHSKAAFEVNKAASMANTIVQTIQAVTKAWSDYGWPYGAVLGAAIAAAGAAQLSAIKSTSFQGGGRGIPPSHANVPNTGTSGGGNGSGGGSGGGPDRIMRVEGLQASSLFDGKSVRVIAEGLLEYQKNGGQVVIQ